MKYVVGLVSFGLSALLAFYLALNIVAVIVTTGLLDIPRQFIAVWPNNLIFGIIAATALALFFADIAVLADRQRNP